MKNRLINLLLILTAYLITCGAVATGTYFHTGLTVEVGDIWNQRKIKAPSYVENKIATERNRAEAEARAENIKPILAQDTTVQDRVDENLNALFIKLNAIRYSYRQEMDAREKAVEEALLAEESRLAEEERQRLEQERTAAETEENPKNVTPSAEPDALPESNISPATEDVAATEPGPFAAYAMFSSLPVIFTEAQQQYLLTMPEDEYEILTGTVYDVADNSLEQGIQDVDNKTLLSVKDEFSRSLLNENAANIGYVIVSSYLIPNVAVNEEATRQERESIASNYEIVYLQKDQTVVDEGDMITEETYAIMESLGMLNTGLEDKLIPMIGVFLLIAFLFLACVIYLGFFTKNTAARQKEHALLFSLYVFILAITWVIGNVGYPFLPILIFAMLVSILLDPRLSVLLSLGMTTVGYFIINGTIDYLFFYLISGSLICLLAKYTTERNKVFMVGLVAAIINFVLSCSISLLVEQNNALAVWQSILTTGGYAALNGLLTVIICTGSLPLWEALFGVVTPVKLLDLTNPTNLLLRRLTIEAPGTYHHSLIVANLAETAAYDIGANPSAARAGGYYHDIGKLKYPQYFVENLAGENPHDHLDPFNSVQLIVSHVAYGLSLAAEYRLPQFIREIIREHHGTSLIYFFYCKAKKEAEALSKPAIDEKEFRYPFVIPQSRESACVMLADTVEAAVRSMIPRVKSPDEVENLINSLIRDKLNDGQLADSGLSIKDVSTIAASFHRVLKGMYHERIPYPARTPEPPVTEVE